jgi:hypothetical protein
MARKFVYSRPFASAHSRAFEAAAQLPWLGQKEGWVLCVSPLDKMYISYLQNVGWHYIIYIYKLMIICTIQYYTILCYAMLYCTILFHFCYIYIYPIITTLYDRSNAIHNILYILYATLCIIISCVHVTLYNVCIYIYNPVVSPNGGCWCPIDNITFDKHKVMRQEVARVKKARMSRYPLNVKPWQNIIQGGCTLICYVGLQLV